MFVAEDKRSSITISFLFLSARIKFWREREKNDDKKRKEKEEISQLFKVRGYFLTIGERKIFRKKIPLPESFRYLTLFPSPSFSSAPPLRYFSGQLLSPRIYISLILTTTDFFSSRGDTHRVGWSREWPRHTIEVASFKAWEITFRRV